MIRLASFNVENLFERAKLFGDGAGQPGHEAVLDAFGEFNKIVARPLYSPLDKARLLELAGILGVLEADDAQFVTLRANRGKLFDRSAGPAVRVRANGNDDWIGWLELKNEAVNEASTRNTARVIGAVNADILVVIEAEHRGSLNRFNRQVLQPTAGLRYEHVILIDGNDERGIDVGVMSKAALPIDFMRSHVGAMRADGTPLFSRDCPEFYFDLPGGRRLLLMANHFKSKRTDSPAEATKLRREQATYVRALYDKRLAEGFDLIAVAGDLNDTPQSAALQPLLGNGSSLTDISRMPRYESGGLNGTHGNCDDEHMGDKLDYILCSPALAERVTGAGIDRSGMWGRAEGNRWTRLEQLTRRNDAASDHAALYVDLDL